MRKKSVLLMPSAKKVMDELGENIKLARLRRKYSTQIVAERANISRPTLWKIEKGDPSVAIGNYVQVLFILGLEKDLLEVAKDNILGRKLQDLQLLTKKRAPKKSKPKKSVPPKKVEPLKINYSSPKTHGRLRKEASFTNSKAIFPKRSVALKKNATFQDAVKLKDEQYD